MGQLKVILCKYLLLTCELDQECLGTSTNNALNRNQVTLSYNQLDIYSS